jgi:hypothetical protein
LLISAGDFAERVGGVVLGKDFRNLLLHVGYFIFYNIPNNSIINPHVIMN